MRTDTNSRMTEQPERRARKSLLDIVLGRPLADGDDHEQVGPAAGIPVFGLDALSSSAYGPEAALTTALTMLLALGSLGIVYLLPITLTIVTLLSIVYFSYRQTIAAYPNGGGAYTVASENLGTRVGSMSVGESTPYFAQFA